MSEFYNNPNPYDSRENNAANQQNQLNQQSQQEQPNQQPQQGQQSQYSQQPQLGQQSRPNQQPQLSQQSQYNQQPQQGQQNQYKVPDYSFWAEQAQSSQYQNNQGASGWDNNGNVPYGNNIPNRNSSYGNQYNNMNQPYGSAMNNQYGYEMNQPYGNQAERQPKKQKKNTAGGKVLKFLGKAVCFGLIAAVSFFGFQKLYFVINPDSSVESVIDSAGKNSYEVGYTQPGTVQVVENSNISDVTSKTLPSIVSIDSTSTQTDQIFGQQFQVQGSGSGIIVGKNDKELLIATNNHVVEGTDQITVTFMDGTQAAAVIKGTDATADLAVVTVKLTDIKADTLNKIAIAKLGNSDEVKVGEMAIAIGNALGYGQSVTVGYISAKDREVDVSDGYNSKKMVLLQTDAAINPGNSGGALLNSKGEVIGINTVKYASNEVEGMGYAIPISNATPIITELMNREVLSEEEQGFLGITGGDVTEDVSSYYNMPIGVFINELSKGGAAEKAGLLAGDIITKVDDIEVTSITQLRDYVNSRRAGTDVEITYMRNTNGTYEEGKMTVTLGQNPNLSDTNN